MRHRFALIALLLSGIATRADAAPPDPALQQQLLGVYDRYSKFILAGKLADAGRLRTGSARTELLSMGKKSKRDQAEMLQMAQLMTPDEIVPVHANVAKNGKTVTILVVAAKTWPAGLKIPDAPKPGTVTHGELTLEFAREGQDWKLSDQIFGPDPGALTVCHDDPAEAKTAYDTGRSSDVGGLIRRVEFKPDHTLVVIRIVDEENCLILPPRETISQNDGHPDKLVPFALIEAEGAPHRTDKQRFWADKWNITDEE